MRALNRLGALQRHDGLAAKMRPHAASVLRHRRRRREQRQAQRQGRLQSASAAAARTGMTAARR
jgi:hypothetical protein